MLPPSQNTDNSWTSSTNCWNKIHKRLKTFCQFFSFAISFWLLTKVCQIFQQQSAKNNKLTKAWKNVAIFLSNLYLCKIWQTFDKIIDNKVPISQTFHEIFANVLSLAFFFCYHQFVLYRMTQNLNFWGRWCDLSVSRQYIWYVQFVAYSFFYQSSIFFYWEECWKKQVVKKYNL